MKLRAVALTGLALTVLFVSSCATKKYVRNRINERATPLENRTGELEETSRRNTQEISRLSRDLEDVRLRADGAQTQADQAAAAAEQANTRVTGVERTVADLRSNLDKYTVQKTVTVLFDAGRYELLPGATVALDELAGQIRDRNGFLLEIEGFASSDGDPLLNERLSEARSESVRRYLAERHNIPIFRMFLLGFGESRPIADNSTPEGRMQNRRVQVRLLTSNAAGQQQFMRFGIEIPSGKPYDAVALGLNAVDHLIVVPHYPEFNSKVRLVSHQTAPGGQCATAMVALARLGLRTRYIGKVGDDETGRIQIRSLKVEGVDSSGVIVVAGAESQTAFIIVDQETGERTVLWQHDERLIISPIEVDRDVVTSGRVLLLDGHNVDASITAATFARAAGIPTVIDIDNIYPGAERLLPLIDFLISSRTFPERMTGERELPIALKLLSERYGAVLVAATLGRDGVLAYFSGGYYRSPGFRVETRDTTGAGDAFHGGFIYGLLAGLTVEETLRFANAVAALKCTSLGARTALPSLDQVKALLRGPNP